MSVATIDFTELFQAVEARHSEASNGSVGVYELSQINRNTICETEVAKLPADLQAEALAALKKEGYYEEVAAPSPGECMHYLTAETCPWGCFEHDHHPDDEYTFEDAYSEALWEKYQREEIDWEAYEREAQAFLEERAAAFEISKEEEGEFLQASAAAAAYEALSNTPAIGFRSPKPIAILGVLIALSGLAMQIIG